MLKKISIAVLTLCAMLAVEAEDIQVGDRTITVPYPDDFVELTPQMSPYYESMNAYIAQTNTRFVTLLTRSDGEALLDGDTVEVNRYINIESENSIIASSVTASDFAELRQIYRTQIDTMYEDVQGELSSMLQDGNEALSDALSVDVVMEMGGLVPMPIHLDTENMIANSLLVTTAGTVDGADVGGKVVAGTSLILHIKDKVIFIYVYGSENDLDWTQGRAEAFAMEIVAANPLSSDEQAAVEKSSSSLDWGRVGEKALIGAIIGGLIGAISMLFRRREKK